MGKLNTELAKLREAHVRATRAIEAAEAPVDVGRDRDAGLVPALHPDDQTQIVLSGGVIANLVASSIGYGSGDPTDEADEAPFASDDVPFA
ncbi:hypothetical protein HYZ80_02680 [Candidatus Parcubacteria bacterium]|nr:hypothetical protein [Candidatus Parcubacteria bacterium]